MNDNINRWRQRALAVGVLGGVASVAAFWFDRDEFLRSYLVAILYWVGMAIGCLGILLLHHTVGGKWGLVIRRPLEAGARTLPYAGVLFVVPLLAMPTLYSWARPEAASDPLIQQKSAYLNMPFFAARTVSYFLIWSFYAYRLSSLSRDRDSSPAGDVIAEKMRAMSAPGLLVFVLTATFAFVDWVMSLTPDWYSTIYGAMFIVGQTLSAFALVIGLLVVLSRWEPLAGVVTAQHFHDLGNLLLAFTALWAYLSFSQFLIIWSGNLPDEVPWYVVRLGGGWGMVAGVLVLVHFLVPFLLLLQRGVKRHPSRLVGVCALLLLARFADIYWLVMPSFGVFTRTHWIDCVAPLAVGGLWCCVFLWQLGMRPLLPLNEPRLAEAPRETVAL